ncbi:MAG TPA: hypothetical protein VEU47_04530 [Candidatus Cybelea sp.]|nr:hypothetical protein [Candidatus Cybelea sp.]
MSFIIKALGFLGHHATRALGLGVLIGLVFPRLADFVRPFLLPGLVIPLTIALMRLDWRSMLDYGRRPLLVGTLAAWMLLASPVLMAGVLWLTSLPIPLKTALVLMAAAPPIVSSAALGLILGLDAPLIVVVTVVSTALVPLTLPPMALWLLGLKLQIGLFDLMGRLAGIVGFAFLAAFALRRLVPAGWIADHGKELDGVTVLTMVLFAIAIMAGVTDAAIARPGYIALVTVVAFVANLALQAVAAGVFAPLGRREALSIGLMSGNCNMGLVLVTVADKAEFAVVVFFALAQIPMYMLPALLLPVYRRLIAR